MAALSGVYVAALTPRREGPEIDLSACFDYFDFLCGAGVDGIALMGSTGEFLHFTNADRSRLVSLAVKRSRVPLIAGVSHSTFDGAVSLARDAADAGAAGVLVMPPYFFPYGPDDIRTFYLRFADAIKDTTPVFLYNIPMFTSPIPCEVLVELLESGRFAGIKDSSGSWEQFQRLLAVRERQPFTLFAGHEILFTRARQAGADGIISGMSSAIPELVVALDRAIRADNTERVQVLDRMLQEFVAWWGKFPSPVGIREAAALRGIRVGRPALPLGPENQRKLAEYAEWFRGWFPAMKTECQNV